MEINSNFIDCFDIDLTSHILALLNDPADLLSASAVSRSWHHFVIANGLFKKLFMRKVPHVAHIAFAAEESDGIIKLSDIASRDAVNWDTLEREHKIYSSILLPLAKRIFLLQECLSSPIGASSARISVNIFSNSSLYWSSIGQIDSNVPEYIIYCLTCDMCIVSEVNIRPCEAFWEPGKPVYSPKSVRFRFGHRKSMENAEFYVGPVDQLSVDKYVWTYISPEYPMGQEPCLQTFKLPEPIVCVGGIFMVELLGRAQRNISDGLFYICLDYIRVAGHPLNPAYMLEIFQNGELQLKFYRHAVDHLLWGFSHEILRGVCEPLDEATDGISLLMRQALHQRFIEHLLINEDD